MADVLKDAVSVFESLLRADFVAQEYLSNRGIGRSASEFFNLGSAGNRGDLHRIMTKECGYSDELLETSGLMKFNGDPLEVFYNSIVIPIKDDRGRIINLSSRKYDNSKMKYINLPNMPLVDFFGVELVGNRHSYTKYKELGDYVVLAEGQFDTIMLQQRGFPAMGIMGVNNIRENMFRHFEWFDTVILCFDNDAPGDKATAQMASYIKQYYPSMRIFRANLGEFNDANDFFLHNTTPSTLIKTVTAMVDVKPKTLKSKKGRPPTTRSTDVVQSIKDINIADFLASIVPGVQWTKVDKLLKTECPFTDHEDTVASFTVYTNNNSYYCWGCGRGGDLIDFCNHFFGIKFKDSVKMLNEWRTR